MVDFPNNPTNGQIHEENGSKWVWNDPPAAWSIVVEAPESGSASTTGPTLPASPNVGDIHYLTVEPVGLYVWYNDGDSSQWVQTNGASGASTTPYTETELYGSDIVGNVTVDLNGNISEFDQILIRYIYIPDDNNNYEHTYDVSFLQDIKSPKWIVMNAGNNFMTFRFPSDTQFQGVGASNIRVRGIFGLKFPKSQGAVVAAGVTEFHDPAGVASWRIVGETLECWGEATHRTSGRGPITYPKSFADNPNVYATASNANLIPSLTSEGVAGCNVQMVNFNGANPSGSYQFKWHAVGKWDGVS